VTETTTPSRIDAAFATLREQSQLAIMPFVTAGYPHMETTEKIVLALAAAGAAAFEIGIPYSDPLADGPTVQHSSQVSLQNGTKLRDVIALVQRLRDAGMQKPIVLMGYYNPLVRYGVEQFVADATTAGVDGFIVPDLPVEESERLHTACKQHGRNLVFMIAPTSTDSLIAETARLASGFIYCVSVTGITGARDQMEQTLGAYLDRIRAKTDVPLAVGFGISRPEHLVEIGKHADGGIIASALMNYLDRFPESEQPERATRFFRYMQGEGDL
jgi:tryptophan synthase alpha chain